MENNVNRAYQEPNKPQYPQATTVNINKPAYPQAVAYPQGRRGRKNAFLTFVCAVVPGCGQMYHGLLKKGISIMFLFWGIIAVSSFVGIAELSLILPVIWFYSFFDAVNRMNMPIEEVKLLEDNYILASVKPQSAFLGKLYSKAHIIFGSGLIFIGVFAFLNSYNVAKALSIFFAIDPQEIRYILSIIPGVLVPIICIVFGICLLFSTFKKEKNSIT